MTTFERIISEDGELGRFVPDTANATIKTAEQLERERFYASMPFKKRFHHGKSYVMSSNADVATIIADLSFNEAGALIKLLLALKMNQGGRLLSMADKPLKRSDIAKVLGRSRKAAGEIIDRLLSIGVLTIEDEYFSINERYHIMGRNTFSGPFTKMYTVRTRSLVSGLKLNEIGLLYKIIPFFHYSEYYLCVDADCRASDIDYQGREGLSRAIGHNTPDTVGRLMRKLQSAGIILITGTKNEVRYLVHPDILFRQAEGIETDWTRSVRKLFEDHARKAKR